MITVIIPTGTRLIIADTEQVIETLDVIRLTLDLDIPSQPILKEVEHFRIGDDLGDSDCPACGGTGTVPGAAGDEYCECTKE
jgi:hypothetical protein